MTGYKGENKKMISDKEQEEIAKYVEGLRTQNQQAQNDLYQQDMDMNQQEKSMIAEQLDLGEELNRIDLLLRGYTLELVDIGDGKKIQKWVKPDNNDLIVLSDYGVHLIRNTIAWYLNKNTLLSNYDEETINHKMEDFASDLNDTIFMEYEKIFQYPTLEDCKKALEERLKKKQELKEFTLELIRGETVSEREKKEIEEQILTDIEPIIEKELNKIKEQIIKNKLKRFLILMREVQDAVHSTYLRALHGIERKSLREHAHISENRGGGFVIQQHKESGIRPFSLLRRK